MLRRLALAEQETKSDLAQSLNVWQPITTYPEQVSIRRKT
jgi:hypothetical protein